MGGIVKVTSVWGFSCLIFIFWTAFSLPASLETSVSLGQITTNGARLNGLAVPSGTTVLHSSEVSATTQPVVVHLVTGEVLELGRHSAVFFERTEGGKIQVEVRSGTLTFRELAGVVRTLPAGTRLTFLHPSSGEGVGPEGVVAVLREKAEAGEHRIRVNDTRRIDPARALLLQSPDGELREVHQVESLSSDELVLKSPLQASFAPQSLLIQGSGVEQAIAAGVVTVGAGQAAGVGTAAGAAAAGAGGLSTATTIAIVAGVAAGVGSVAIVATVPEEKPVSPFQPQPPQP